jgi:hypothetical protein
MTNALTNAPTDTQQNKEQNKMTDVLSKNVPVKGELKNGVAAMDTKDASKADLLPTRDLPSAPSTPLVPEHDPFTAYADASMANDTVGTHLRFAKGDFLAGGKENRPIPIGTSVLD